MELALDKKVAIVTGGAQGIGFEIARTLLSEGVSVLVSDINEKNLEASVEKLSALGSCCAFAGDMQKEDDVIRMIKKAESEFGGVDLLFNNAGVLKANRIADTSLDEWNRMLGLNLTSAFLCSKHALPAMKKRGGGFIACAASFSALIPCVGQGAYAAAKEGVMSLAKTCAAEFAPYKIRVISYTPGMVATSLTAEMRSDPVFAEKLKNDIPLRRFAKADDIASALVFFASDRAGYITGCNIAIHGGKLCVQNPTAAYE